MKIRCLKHKANLIQFICLQNDCQIQKLGCIQCFPDHDGHTRQNMDIQSFFEKVIQKDKQLEMQYLQLINGSAIKKTKEQLIRQIQQKCKAIQSKVFNFLEQQCEAIVSVIQNKNLNDINSQMKVKGFHDELERIKIKSTQSLDNQETEFLLNFILTDEYDEMLSVASSQKEKLIVEFSYDINQYFDSIDFQFKELQNQLNQQLQNQVQEIRNTKLQHNYSFTLGNLPKSPKKQPQKERSKSPLRLSSTNQSRMKTPESNTKIGSTKKINISKFLIASPERNEEEYLKNQEPIIEYLLNNVLKESYLSDNLVILKQNSQEFQDFTKITQKEKQQLIQENKLLYILWDNLMIEWLKPLFNENFVHIKVYEIEDNYQSFVELFDKQLKLFEFVAYVVKQKIKKPKIDYQTWLILGNKATNSYKMYNLKSVGKKINKEMTIEDQQLGGLDQLKFANVYVQFPQILAEHFYGYFVIQRDLKVIMKGIQDPSFQTYLLAERLQVLLNLVTNSQVAIDLSFQQIEKHFETVLINYKSFVNYLNLSLKDLKN